MMAALIELAGDGRTLEARTPVQLFTAHFASGSNIVATSAFARPQYAVSLDGRFLVNAAADQDATPSISIVQNWTVGLKK